MKTWLGNTLAVCAIVTVTVIAAVTCIHRNRQRAETACCDVAVDFLDTLKFVKEKDIRDCIRTNYPSAIGERIGEIDLKRIETFLNDRSAVKESQAWTTDDGILHISIRQRQPSVRFQNGETGFYVDDRGYIFPLQKGYDAPVPLVHGELPLSEGPGYRGKAATPQETLWISRILTLLDFIDGSRQWKGNVSDIRVNRGGSLVLETTLGKEKVIFGQPVCLDEKFQMLATYYSRIVPANDENIYKTVDISNRKRIICKRK